jgi:hypothetical protein
MKVDAVTHFTDEIAAVELSTFRADLTLLIPGMKIASTGHYDGTTVINIIRDEPQPEGEPA